MGMTSDSLDDASSPARQQTAAKGKRFHAGTIVLGCVVVFCALIFATVWIVFPLLGVNAVALNSDNDISLLRDNGASAIPEFMTTPVVGVILDFATSWWGGAVLALLLAAFIVLLVSQADDSTHREGTPLRKLSIRGRMFAALVIPLVVILGAGGWIAASALTDLGVAESTNNVVSAMPSIDSVARALADERNAAIGQDAAAKEQTRQATDESVAKLDSAVSSLGETAFGGDGATKTKSSMERLNAYIEEARGRVGEKLPTETITNGYSAPVDALASIVSGWAAELPDRSIGADLTAMSSLLVYRDTLDVERTAVATLVSLPTPAADTTDGEGNENAAATAAAERYATATRNATNAIFAVNAQRGETDRLVRAAGGDGVALTLPNSDYQEIRTTVTTAGASALSSGQRSSWQTLAAAEVSSTDSLYNQLGQVAASDATMLESDIGTGVIRTIIITLTAVLVACVVAIAIATQLARVLSSLVRTGDAPAPQARPAALPAAPTELPVLAAVPTPAAITAADADVAPSATVPETTGTVTQAFVNVARRDQALLARQLSVLDELERSEEEPDRLTQLFFLDNLATRMRRNSDSLLVLAGGQPGRRVRTPMPLSDVIRTASSEIEQYDRIRLDLDMDPMMIGHNVLSSAHLIAELLENATVFSEPNTPIEVTSMTGPGTMSVKIADVGLGMSQQELDEANRKVSEQSNISDASSGQLGLHVVGRLAKALNAHVTFSKQSDDHGTVVTVTFPASLFTESDDQSAPATSQPLVEADPGTGDPGSPASSMPSAPSWDSMIGDGPATMSWAPDSAPGEDGFASLPTRNVEGGASPLPSRSVNGDKAPGALGEPFSLPPLPSSIPSLPEPPDSSLWAPTDATGDSADLGAPRADIPSGFDHRDAPEGDDRETMVNSILPVPSEDGRPRSSMFQSFRSSAQIAAQNRDGVQIHPSDTVAENMGAPADDRDQTEITLQPQAISRLRAAQPHLNEETAWLLAVRAEIEAKAASLGEGSAYHPSSVTLSSGPDLVERVPSEEKTPLPGVSGPTERDAEKLRARLTSFHEASHRGRQEAPTP